VVLGQVGACKGGCSLIPVEASKPRCCNIFSVVAEETKESMLPFNRIW